MVSLNRPMSLPNLEDTPSSWASLHGLHVGFDSWAQSIRAPGTLMVGYPIGIPMSVAPEYLSDSKSRAWTHTLCTSRFLHLYCMILKCLYEIAHVGYVECFIDYEFLLMIVKGY